MDAFLAIAGFVTVAAITPGPNNFIVMGAAARGGFGAATPAIAGVVAGSLGLLGLVWAGAGVAFEAEPRLRAALALAGSLYLIWLGATIIWRAGGSGRGASSPPRRELPSTAPGVAAFQLLNLKAWVMVVTAAGATSGGADRVSSLAALAAIVAGVTSLCLTLWAVVGAAIADLLKEPRTSRWFDRAMGGLLIGSAGLILV